MDIETLKSNVASAQAAYHAIVDTGNRSQVEAASGAVKAARNALRDGLVTGARPCPGCKAIPHGMLQDVETSKGERMEMVEIGCLACRHHRALGMTQELAVKKWNDGVKVYKPFTTDEDGLPVGQPPTWFVPKKRGK